MGYRMGHESSASFAGMPFITFVVHLHDYGTWRKVFARALLDTMDGDGLRHEPGGP